MKKINIAIDGFSGCGKSTLARDLSNEIGYRFVDTGALYRAVTHLVLIAGRADVSTAIEVLSTKPELNFHADSNHILINGLDAESEIRSARVADSVSVVAAIPEVRDYLYDIQNEFVKSMGVVMEGRDIGSVIMPDAELKLFISARTEVRVQRRLLQMKSMGQSATDKDVLKNLIERDRKDMTRTTAPLRLVKDAIVIDNSDLSLQEQIKCVMAIYYPIVDPENILSGLVRN
jgi:CMP/dCMP kinase